MTPSSQSLEPPGIPARFSCPAGHHNTPTPRNHWIEEFWQVTTTSPGTIWDANWSWPTRLPFEAGLVGGLTRPSLTEDLADFLACVSIWVVVELCFQPPNVGLVNICYAQFPARMADEIPLWNGAGRHRFAVLCCSCNLMKLRSGCERRAHRRFACGLTESHTPIICHQ